MSSMDKISDKKYDPEKHLRRSIRLKDYDYSQTGAYFVTICARNREYLFGKIVEGKMQLNKTGEMIQKMWIELPRNYPGVEIDAFIVMPNHIHGIIVLTGVGAGPCACPNGGQPQGVAPTISLPDVVHRFKSLTTTRYRQTLSPKGLHSLPNRLWQRNYYEHVVRNENELNRIREYIIYNLLQWQFDRENPEYIQDKDYQEEWGDFERMVFGKTKMNNEQARCLFYQKKYYD